MIVGIDLGTTNSLVAHYTEKGPEIIPNRLGEFLTPSVVSMDEDGTIYVGKTAAERMLTHPEDTASLFKRSMGTEKKFFLGQKPFRAEELSSFVLRALKEDAESYLGEPVEEAIVSVPAYFNDLQRQATKKAGELAGLKVERIINEPTAAAIAYGLHKLKEHTKFLVFDLGGGTFDISILELSQNIMEVRAIAGDNQIGGEDFTNVLARMLINKNEIDETTLSAKDQTHLAKQAELCKLGFSEKDTSILRWSKGDKNYEESILLQDFERACEMLLAKMRKPIKRSLRDADAELSQIDEVVLVGGATRLPIIRSFVAKTFGKIPGTHINPDEAIAIGAAIQCAMKQRKEDIKEIVLTEVCPYTLGTSVGRNLLGEISDGGHFFPIIERNTVIPVSRTYTFYTAMDYQKRIMVDILQGESRFIKNNLLLGEITVPVPPGKEGEETIDVTYTYDINSILEVSVKVNSTGVSKKLIFQREGTQISEEDAKKRMEELKHLKIHPRQQEENKLLLLRGERMYEEATGEIRQEIDLLLGEFEKVLSKQKPEEIKEERKILKETLDEIERGMEQGLFE